MEVVMIDHTSFLVSRIGCSCKKILMDKKLSSVKYQNLYRKKKQKKKGDTHTRRKDIYMFVDHLKVSAFQLTA